MNESEYKILEMLSSEIGNPTSISKLTEKIRNTYGKGDYKNIHNTIRDLINRNILKFEKIGNTLIIRLNFENFLLVELLTEIEINKKIRFLKNHPEFQMTILELIMNIRNTFLIKSILLLNPERNAKLNKIELLFISKHPLNAKMEENETKYIQDMLKFLQNKFNIKIEHLFLEDNVFMNYLRSDENNMIQEALMDNMILFQPELFWLEIKESLEKGIRIRSNEQIKPNKISEDEHVYNLERFGYREFGNRIKYGNHIGIESLITSILVKKENIRHIEAISVILAKNDDKINYDLLVFLSMKYGTIDRLYGILKAINAIKPMTKLTKAVEELAGMKINEINVNMKDMEEKLRLYNVIQ